ALRVVETAGAVPTPETPESGEPGGAPGGSPDGGELWPAWFEAQLALGRDDFATERAALVRLLARAPGFRPAWVRLRQLRANGVRDPRGDRKLVALRQRRIDSLGELAGKPGDVEIDRARFLLQSGDVAGAQAAADSAAGHGASAVELGDVRARI